MDRRPAVGGDRYLALLGEAVLVARTGAVGGVGHFEGMGSAIADPDAKRVVG